MRCGRRVLYDKTDLQTYIDKCKRKGGRRV